MVYKYKLYILALIGYWECVMVVIIIYYRLVFIVDIRELNLRSHLYLRFVNLYNWYRQMLHVFRYSSAS